MSLSNTLNYTRSTFHWKTYSVSISLECMSILNRDQVLQETVLLKQQIISYKLQFALGLHSEIQAKTKGTIRDNIILFVFIHICNLAVVGLHRAP